MSPVRALTILAFIYFFVFLFASGSSFSNEQTPGLFVENQPELSLKNTNESPKDKRTAIKLVFTGNSALSDKELRNAASEELSRLDDLSRLKATAEDAGFQMETKYRSKGYPFASINYTLKESDEESLLSFIIKEGSQVTIREVNFIGNTVFSRETLLPYFTGRNGNGNGILGVGKKAFVEAAMESATSRIKELYYYQGYQDVDIQSPQLIFSSDISTVDIFININEGTQYAIDSIVFSGDVFPEASDQLRNLEQEFTGKPYYPRRKLELKNGITELYQNLGYLDVQGLVSSRELGEKGRLTLNMNIVSGPQVTISRYIFSGNEKTQSSFLENRITLKPGNIYSLKKKRESFRELYKTGLFSKIDMKLQPEKTDSQRALAVTVHEHPSKEVYSEIGWGSYELLRLRGGFRENNLFGKGRVLKTEAGVSFKSEDVILKVTDPWFLGTEYSADLPVFFQRREEPAFKRKDSGGAFFISKEFRNDVMASVGYLYRSTSLTDIEIESVLNEVDNNYNIGSVRFQVSKDKRDDIFMPTKGYKLFFSEDYSDKFFGSDIKYLRTTGGVRYFHPVKDDIVFGMRFDTGFILPVDDQVELPLAERFYNGGENSVRSFREDRLGPNDLSGDPVGGMAYNIVSLELRKNMSRNFSMSLFTDFGNIAPNTSRIEKGQTPYSSRSEIINDTFNDYFSDFRGAVGFGFQYLLPVGPARLDLAFNPDQRQERDERDYAIHFSIGMAF